MSTTASFLKETATGREIFLDEPPSDFVAPSGWEVIDRDVTEQELSDLRDIPYYKLFDYCSEQVKKKPIHTINFKTELNTSLYFERDYVYGRKLRTTAYAFDQDGAPDFTEKILEVTWDHEIDSKRMVTGGCEDLGYWMSDGTFSANSKKMPFHYNANEQAIESEERRRRIISELKSSVQELLMALGQDPATAYTNGEAFMAANQTYVDAYVQRANYDLVTEMQNSTEAFMDLTPTGYNESIRDFIVNRLDYKAAEDASAAANGGTITLYRGSEL